MRLSSQIRNKEDRSSKSTTSVTAALAVIIFIVSVFSCKEQDILFEKVSESESNVHFSNTLEKKKAFGILYYLYYYNGGGVSTGDINNDGLTDIYFTANSKGNNKLFLNKGNFKFEDITEKSGVKGTSDWCTGTTMADVNGDGHLDIYVSSVNNTHRLQGHNELFINNGNGTFNERSKEYGLDFSGFSTQAAFFDYDHDGDLDCYVLNQSHKPNQYLVPISNRSSYDSLSGDRLYRNDLNSPVKKFTDVSKAAGIYQSGLGYGLGLGVADINNDGWEDIYVGNDFHENDYYYINTGKGAFIESGADHFGHYSRFSMGNDIADYNNDGQLDIVTVDMLPDDEKVLKTYGSDENPDIYKFKLERNGYQYQYSRNCLQQNNGDGSSFSELGLLAGVSATDWSWCPLFADFDNDGLKDLFISSGIVSRPVDLDYVKFVSDLYIQKNMDKTDRYDEMALEKMPDGAAHPYFFKGTGDISFQNVSDTWGTGSMKGYFNGASYADLDNDGDLDVIINSLNSPAVILKNKTVAKHSISVSLKGEGMNTSGIGAKVYLYQSGRLQYQQLMLTRGFQSSSDPKLNFGLDTLSAIDSLVVVWPSQKFQVVRRPTSDSRMVLQEKNATGVFRQNQAYGRNPDSPLAASSTIKSDWKHIEDNFTDFNIQYLIPHALSTKGPKIAIGDVNGDGLDDMYACGAKGQSGSLLIQQKGGQLLPSSIATFLQDSNFEDVDAHFFDANGDGKLDLYVASGGNEYITNSEFLLDRLYLNTGNGQFQKSESTLPRLAQNKSCVTVADFDKDGDQDIFIGVLADSRAYGIPQTSYLLINNGKGIFSLATDSIIDLKEIGMVTSAEFTDVNRDTYPDLVIAGEWMPLTIFINKKGSFEKTTLPNSSGLWQSVFVDDVNNDGNPDILAGNWGLNNKFHSGKNGPIRLYVKDFDKNGKIDQLLSYTLNGKEYPFLAKDEIERPLPVLKKHYVSYAEYAGVEMKDVFYGFVETVKPLSAEILASVVCFGNGKGGFLLQPLPLSQQLTPISTFQKISVTPGLNSYIAGGNFFDVIPYEGRYDAQPLSMFSITRQNKIQTLPGSALSSIKGQVRDIQWMRTKDKLSSLVIARNNSPLMSFQSNEKNSGTN